ncbi:hypothetical protein [Ruania rhizosphaerae]|uniref:hypothetical protein n=1 Tax=Ruania rhizosphaerae TaxID=1840413 RepID=UPI001359EEC9|nr:hypothetical protein [Ruania rhizosphaerae]
MADLPTRVADLIADALDGAAHLLDNDDAQQLARLADQWRANDPGDLDRINTALTTDGASNG